MVLPGININLHEEKNLAQIQELLANPFTRSRGEQILTKYEKAKQTLLDDLKKDFKNQMKQNIIRNHSIVTGRLLNSIVETPDGVAALAQNKGEYYGLNVEYGTNHIGSGSALINGQFVNLNGKQIKTRPHPFIEPTLKGRRVQARLREFYNNLMN